MPILGYLRSGETVTGHNSYVNSNVLSDALRRIDSRGNKTIHLPVDMGKDLNGEPLPEKEANPVGRPQVVKLEEDDMIYFRQRLKGDAYYPFVIRPQELRTNTVSVHMEKTEGGYHLKIACYGPFYERDSNHPFWKEYAFNMDITPHKEKAIH